MSFKIIAFIFLVFGLYKNYQWDKGLHQKAKVIHATALVYFIYHFGSSFGYIGWILRNFEVFEERYKVQVGIISANMNFYSTLFHVFLCLLIIWFAFGMISRKNSSRQNLLRVLPLIIPTETISMYRGFQGSDPIPQDFLVLGVGFIIALTLNFGLFFLYRSKIMIDFFNQPALDLNNIKLETDFVDKSSNNSSQIPSENN